MLDGISRNDNITDNFRLEEMLLKRQGWKYYKIYSPSYIEDPINEGKRILDFLRNEIEAIDKKEDTESFIVEEKDTLASHFIDYKAMPNETLMKNYMNKGLEYAMLEFLKVEEPVNKDYYLKKCAIAMGKTKVTNVVKNEAAKSIPQNAQLIGNTYWLNPKDTFNLRINSLRMINEIPLEELKEGIYTIVSYSEGITVEGAFKALLKLLGFSRLTDNTKKLLMDAVVFLKLEGRIIQRGECLYI